MAVSLCLKHHFANTVLFTNVFCDRNGKLKLMYLPKRGEYGNIPAKYTGTSPCHVLPSAKATAVFFIIPHSPLEFVQLIKIAHAL